MHSQGFCEWFKHNLKVVWVKLGPILQLKVGRLNFGPVRDSAIYPTYVYRTEPLTLPIYTGPNFGPVCNLGI